LVLLLVIQLDCSSTSSGQVSANLLFALLLLLLPLLLVTQLDASSTSSDRSALTTVPQLSSAGLLKAAADLAGGRLFALLSNGHVHVWELHLTRPPALQVGCGCMRVGVAVSANC
jgi:hypothetical protein